MPNDTQAILEAMRVQQEKREAKASRAAGATDEFVITSVDFFNQVTMEPVGGGSPVYGRLANNVTGTIGDTAVCYRTKRTNEWLVIATYTA